MAGDTGPYEGRQWNHFTSQSNHTGIFLQRKLCVHSFFRISY